MTSDTASRIDGRKVVVSISGGKDSTATALHLKELGIEAEYVHMDTGWEAPETVEYVRDYLPGVLGHIEVIGRPGGMEALVKAKGMFPSRLRRFCTQELKVFPARAYFNGLGVEVVNVVGIRAEESATRAKMVEWEESTWFDGLTWRPILHWSMADVVAIHARHGVRPNPLYLSGSERVGCFPCIFARKDEIRNIADHHPAAIDRLRVLEAEVGDAAQARHDARGEIMRTRPAWFHSHTRRTDDCWPIDKVVKWSRTAHGGRQYELFSSVDADAGCMRWGLCDTGSER